MRSLITTGLVFWLFVTIAVPEMNTFASDLSACLADGTSGVKVLSAQAGARNLPKTENQFNRIFVDRLLEDLLPEFKVYDQKMSNSYGGPSDSEAKLRMILAFIRDYFPFQLEDGRYVEYASYAKAIINSNAFYDGGSSYVPIKPPAGSPEGARFYQIDNKPVWRGVVTLPLLMEGGNLLITKKVLITSRRLLDQNSKTIAEHVNYLKRSSPQEAKNAVGYGVSLAEAGYRPRTEAEVIHTLASTMAMDDTQVLVLPWFPGDVLGHVDMHIGVVNATTVAVPYIPEAELQNLLSDHPAEYHFALGVNAEYAETVRLLTATGLKVLRLPEQAPIHLKASSVSPLGYDGDFLSPVNWVQKNGVMYVPEYREGSRFRPEIERILLENGIQSVVFVNANLMIGTHGAIHCVTAGGG